MDTEFEEVRELLSLLEGRNVDRSIRALYKSAAALVIESKVRALYGPRVVEAAVQAHAGQIRPYSMRDVYARGDVISNPKFGHGIVRRSYRSGESGRIDVMFGDKDRTLIAGPPTSNS